MCNKPVAECDDACIQGLMKKSEGSKRLFECGICDQQRHVVLWEKKASYGTGATAVFPRSEAQRHGCYYAICEQCCFTARGLTVTCVGCWKENSVVWKNFAKKQSWMQDQTVPRPGKRATTMRKRAVRAMWPKDGFDLSWLVVGGIGNSRDLVEVVA